MSPATVQLIPLQCVRCQNPLPAQPGEVFWVCPSCGQGQLLHDDLGVQPQTIRYTAGISQNTKGKPVWVVTGQAALRRSTYDAFDKRGEMEQFWAQPRTFYIPAYDLPLDQLTASALGALRQPPRLQEVAGPAAFLPVTVHSEDLQPLAEYILLAIEADRKDNLKQLDINLKLGGPELWILA